MTLYCHAPFYKLIPLKADSITHRHAQLPPQMHAVPSYSIHIHHMCTRESRPYIQNVIRYTLEHSLLPSHARSRPPVTMPVPLHSTYHDLPHMSVEYATQCALAAVKQDDAIRCVCTYTITVYCTDHYILAQSYLHT